MTKDELQFLKMFIVDQAEYYSKQLKPSVVNMMAEDLSDLELSEITKAYNQIRMDPSQVFFPLPALVRQKVDGYPSADEALGIVPMSEDASYVTCDEIAQAFGAARHFLDAGDMNSFRRVFTETYDSLVSKSRAAKLRPKWWGSMGFDSSTRDECLKKAVEMNRLTPQAALAYSHTLKLPPPTRAQAALSGPNSGLLTAPVNEEPDEMSDEKRQQRINDIESLVSNIGKKITNEEIK